MVCPPIGVISTIPGVHVSCVGVASKSCVAVGVIVAVGIAVVVHVGVRDAVDVGDGVAVLVVVSVACGSATVGVTPGRVTTHPDNATVMAKKQANLFTLPSWPRH